MLYPVLVLTNRILIVKYRRFGASLVAMLRVIALSRHHMVMSGFYDFRLVALSVAVAMLASFGPRSGRSHHCFRSKKPCLLALGRSDGPRPWHLDHALRRNVGISYAVFCLKKPRPS